MMLPHDALHILLRATVRVVRRCGTQAQAVAFNMFLTFFPMVLLVFTVLSSTHELRSVVQEFFVRLRAILPPGSQLVVVDFLVRRATHPWRWATLGVVGTLLAGMQVMKVFMNGFHAIHGDAGRPGFWSRQARSLLLLLATILPWLAAMILTVFSKQLCAWLIRHLGLPVFFRGLWAVGYVVAALAIAMLVLAIIYRVGRPAARTWREVLPGAVVATLLWWGLNSAFGAYVRKMQYSLVFGSLATAIGLLVWMQLNALVVFLGEAFNAEWESRR